MCQKRSSRKREGFTLTEVVVASAILMIVFVATLEMFTFARRSASITENRLASLHVARQTLESLVNLSYTSPFLTVGTKQLQDNRGRYIVTEDTNTKTKDITVIVEWVETWGLEQSVSLTTSLSRSLHK